VEKGFPPLLKKTVISPILPQTEIIFPYQKVGESKNSQEEFFQEGKIWN